MIRDQFELGEEVAEDRGRDKARKPAAHKGIHVKPQIAHQRVSGHLPLIDDRVDRAGDHKSVAPFDDFVRNPLALMSSRAVMIVDRLTTDTAYLSGGGLGHSVHDTDRQSDDRA
jgi:hypothetical protein